MNEELRLRKRKVVYVRISVVHLLQETTVTYEL